MWGEKEGGRAGALGGEHSRRIHKVGDADNLKIIAVKAMKRRARMGPAFLFYCGIGRVRIVSFSLRHPT